MSSQIFYEEVERRFVLLGYEPNSGGNISAHTSSRGFQIIGGICHHKYFTGSDSVRLELYFGFGPSGDKQYNKSHYRILFEQREIVDNIFDETFAWVDDKDDLSSLVYGETKVNFSSKESRKEATDWMVGRVHQMHIAVSGIFRSL